MTDSGRWYRPALGGSNLILEETFIVISVTSCINTNPAFSSSMNVHYIDRQRNTFFRHVEAVGFTTIRHM